MSKWFDLMYKIFFHNVYNIAAIVKELHTSLKWGKKRVKKGLETGWELPIGLIEREPAVMGLSLMIFSTEFDLAEHLDVDWKLRGVEK